MRPSRPGDSRAIFLSRFARGAAAENLLAISAWREWIAGPLDDQLSGLLREGLIRKRDAELAELLELKYRAIDLKKIAKERGLKTSGSKAELAARLSEGRPDEMRAATSGLTVFELTANGRRAAEDFQGHACEMRSGALTALLAGDVATARATAEQLNSEMGEADDGMFNYLQPESHFRRILAAKPRILAGLAEEELKVLRIAAAMNSFGWGERWLPEGFRTKLKIDNKTAVRMIYFYVRQQEDAEQYRSIGVTEVFIMVANHGAPQKESRWDVCVECLPLKGTVWPINKVPDLPYSMCTQPIGCRCMALPVLPGE